MPTRKHTAQPGTAPVWPRTQCPLCQPGCWEALLWAHCLPPLFCTFLFKWPSTSISAEFNSAISRLDNVFPLRENKQTETNMPDSSLDLTSYVGDGLFVYFHPLFPTNFLEFFFPIDYKNEIFHSVENYSKTQKRKRKII